MTEPRSPYITRADVTDDTRTPNIAQVDKAKVHAESNRRDPEDELDFQLRAVGLTFERQYRAVKPRRFVWDFAIPDARLLVEVNGGTWVHGMGHSTGTGIKRDYEKANLATLHGWRQLTFTSGQVYSGEALRMIEEYLQGEAK